MRVVTKYPQQTPFFQGYSAANDGSSSYSKANQPATQFAGNPSKDSFQRFGYVTVPSASPNNQVAVMVSPLRASNPFSLTASSLAAGNLASRIKALMNDPSLATANTKALFDAAAGKLTTDPVGLTAAEREAQSIVQEARHMDPSSKLKLVNELSGGYNTVASQLASQALQQHRPVGMGDLISAWREQPNTEANRGLSDAMSVLGTALLSLQIVAPAGMVSPSLMNGFLNTAAILAL